MHSFCTTLWRSPMATCVGGVPMCAQEVNDFSLVMTALRLYTLNPMTALRSGEQTVVCTSLCLAACAGVVALRGAGARRTLITGDEDVLRDTTARMVALKAHDVSEQATVSALPTTSFSVKPVDLVVLLAHPTCFTTVPPAALLKALRSSQLLVLWYGAPTHAEEAVRALYHRQAVCFIGGDWRSTDHAYWESAIDGVCGHDDVYSTAARTLRKLGPDGAEVVFETYVLLAKCSPPANVAGNKRDFSVAYNNRLDEVVSGLAASVVCCTDDVMQYLKKSRHKCGHHQIVSMRTVCGLAPLALEHAVAVFPIAPDEKHVFARACSALWAAGVRRFVRTVVFYTPVA